MYQLQWRIQGRGLGAAPLFLDQNEAWTAEKKIFWDRPPLSCTIVAKLMIVKILTLGRTTFYFKPLKYSVSIKTTTPKKKKKKKKTKKSQTDEED